MSKMTNSNHIYDYIKAAYTTEKAFKLRENNVYSFIVDKNANKMIIKKAIEEFFGVTVQDVRFVNTYNKGKNFKGVQGKAKVIKKAYVSLANDSKIDLSVKV